MRLYDKRIAFMISDQHLIPHGGLGSFAKCFTEMCTRLNWKVDLILDKKPSGDFYNTLLELGAGTFYPLDKLEYDEHLGTYAFSDSINFEQIINFRKSIIESFRTNSYDMILCNTQEAMTAVYALNLGEYIPIVFYTHQPSAVTRERDSRDVFLQSYHDFYNKHFEFPNIVVGTHSERNKKRLLGYGAHNVEVLPTPMSERELLLPSKEERTGLLYIGRWEPRKNPEAFLKIAAETKLPVRIMTNALGKKKFEKELLRLVKENPKDKDSNDVNVYSKDFVIKTEIYGKEKADFIKSCKVHFNTAYSESWSFVFFECLAQTHCVILEDQDWSDNFDSKYYHTVKLKDAAKKILELHEKPVPTEQLEYIKSIDNQADNAWYNFVNNFKGKHSDSNAAKINKETIVKHEDFIKKLTRTYLAQEDIESVLGNRHKFKVIYTDNNTYYSKDENFVPNEEEEILLEFGR